MNAEQYCNILEESFLGTLSDKGLTLNDVIFQQDNDPKHTSKHASAWFEAHGVTQLPWPASSPDMNIIEHAWEILDRKLRSRHRLPSNLNQLWEALKEEWEKLDMNAVRALYESMPRRIAALEEAGGSYTRY